MFSSSRQKRRERESARLLYEGVVRQARSSLLYAKGGVPDTVDGRFEMVVFHTYAVVSRLMAGEERLQRIAQYLFDVMVVDMDRSLREMGVGDLSVGKKVKAMAEAYYGRSRAYDLALAGEDGALAQTLKRNVFGTLSEGDRGPHSEALDGMVRYVEATIRTLNRQTAEELAAGEVCFASYS